MKIMSNTKIILDKKHLSAEMTKEFLRDHELACQTMEIDDFAQLFLKYDLSFIDDYSEVITSIAESMMDWKKEFRGTELQKVTRSDSNCIFCNIGKEVKVYEWFYKHTNASEPTNRILYSSKIAFYFSLENEKLTDYGVCNAYRDKNEM